MSQRYSLRLIPILLLVAAAVWVDLPSNPGIHIGSFQRDIRVVRGLDLQGGLRVLLEADLPPDVEITADQMQTVRNIIENRVNGLGVTEPLVQIAGSRRILVELPGIDNPDQAVATLRETGLLEFIEVPAEDRLGLLSGQIIPQTDFATGSAPSESTSTATPETTSTAEPTPTAGAIPSGEAEATPTAEPAGPEVRTYHTVMTGAMLRTAAAWRDPNTGQYVVNFELTDEGARIFGDYTSTHVGGYLGILLDKQVISIPVISEGITGGKGSISGSFTLESANQLAVQLKYGALPIPLTEAESKVVGPTLGEDSLRKSMIAGVLGLAVVVLFMALYYRLPGILADLALLVYALLTFALFKLIPVTLTLPGIAGFVLSIGVAVDANILIFERMKEELRAGRALRQAIDLGFRRAWPSIRDSNLSTLITCGILYWFGSTFGASIVKGFSLTLALGVGVSLFTAITVTRTFLHVVLDSLRLTEHPRWFGV
ncbi:MAG: protein translocase subunit SecD [Chloroflexota bacterium]